MIELKRFERKDIPQLLEWIDSEKLLRQWGGSGFDYPLDEKQLHEYVDKSEKEEPELFAYKVVLKESGEVIGHLSLARIDHKHRQGRIGRVLVGSTAARGKGIGKEMMTEALKIAFEKFGLHRVSLGVFDFNTPAIKCYEKVGFIKEGLLRETLLVEGVYWNVWEMSMLEDEWRAAKKG